MKILMLFLTIAFISGCTNAEKKKPLHYLNGENYHVSPDQKGPNAPLPLPVGKHRLTRLKGAVLLSEGATRIPLKMQKIYLKKDDTVLGETVSNIDGTFYFTEFIPTEHIKLRATAKPIVDRSIFKSVITSTIT